MKIEQNYVAEDFWPGKKPVQRVSVGVHFSTPFKVRPFIMLSLEKLEEGQFIERSNFFDKDKPLLHTVHRVNMAASNVTNTGFILELSTWNNNAIYGYRINWIAISPED